MSYLIDHASQLASKSELDLFSLPPTQVVIDSSVWVPIYPKNAIDADSEGPYEFTLERDFEYLDLSTSWIHMQLSVTRNSGDAIEDLNVATGDPPVIRGMPKYEAAPINNIGSSFFRALKVYFNSRLVYDSGPTYAYRCYIEDTLNYSPLMKDTMLQAAGYFTEEHTLFNSHLNGSYQKRGKMAHASRHFDILAPLHADCFSHDRLLPSQMQVRLEAYKNPNRFTLLSLGDANATDEYKLKIHHISWLVRKVALAPSMANTLEARLSKQPARYPIRRVSCRTFHIDQNTNTVRQLQLSMGQLPRRIVLGMVEAAAFQGNYKRNPLEFKHNELSRLQLTAGGVPIPRNPLECDFANNRYARAYVSLFNNLNTGLEDTGNGISYAGFANGYGLFAFDLTSDQSETWHLIREGTVTLDADFATPVPQGGLKLIVYYEMENLMMITKNRETFFDFSQ